MAVESAARAIRQATLTQSYKQRCRIILTIALIVIGSIISAVGVAFAIWSILDTNGGYARRK